MAAVSQVLAETESPSAMRPGVKLISTSETSIPRILGITQPAVRIVLAVLTPSSNLPWIDDNRASLVKSREVVNWLMEPREALEMSPKTFPSWESMSAAPLIPSNSAETAVSPPTEIETSKDPSMEAPALVTAALAAC